MIRSLIVTLVVVSLASAQTVEQAQQYPPSGYPPMSQSPYGQQPQQQYPAYGEDQQQAEDQQHGVARLSIVQGDVNIKRGDNGQLSAAVVNAPVISHDHLETAPGSRAEVELDSATMLRLAPNTDIGFADLEFHRAQVQIGIGTIILRVLRDGATTQVEVDTPTVGLRPLAIGEYRISVFDNGTSQVTVRSGRLEMSGPRGSQTVEPGQSLMIRGDAADPEFQAAYEIPRDQLDEWSAARDGELLSSQSYRYVSRDVDGAEDLDRYGNWVPSQYGQVWAPQAQTPDWSPYSNGHWVWEDYYGWTWVDYAPWGWAPYHYGRWFWNMGHGWCWWPGARVGFSFWSPAQVAFFGWGVGGLGWVALAPFELFHAWWGHGFGHYNYGFERGGEFARLYRNAGVRGGAMTAAGLNAFAGPEHRYSPATRGQLGAASVFRGALPFAATAAAYRFSSRQAVSNQRLAASGNRQFFSRSQFNQAPRSNSYRAPLASVPAARTSSRFASNGARGGWQSFGSPGRGTAAPRQSFVAPRSESGWHSFGQPQVAPRQNYGYVGGSRSAPSYSAPRYSAPPQQQHYSAPAAPRYKAPSAPSHSSGGGSRSSGGGHSSGGGGHHRR